jgi:hypothetical protein
MPVQTRIQIRRGTTSQWAAAANSLGYGILYEGELGYDTDKKIFKIGDGSTHWTNLGSAGGSELIPGSGIILDPSGTNSYIFHNVITASGNGLSANVINLGTSDPSGSYYSISLNEKLRDIAALSGQGFIVTDGLSNIYERVLSSGSNIILTNANGVSGNPTIGINSNITGLNSISGVNGFTISTASGMSLNAGAGVVSVDDLDVDGTLYVGNGISIELAAAILAQGSIIYSGNPTRFQGDVYFDNIPKVGPTGNGGINATGVSLSGHKHVWTDVTDFCSGVADCVDTSLLAGTGIQFISGTNSLTVALSGQSLNLHNFTGTGILVRDNTGTFYNRAITSSNNNILLNNVDGVGGNIQVNLNNTITGLNSLTSNTLSTTNITTSKILASGSSIVVESPDVNVTGNLRVGGNVLINGTGVLVQSTVVVIDDPIFTLGGSGTALNDSKDRGIEFKYNDGSSRIGFFGYQDSSDKFIFLRQATNTNEVFSGTKGEIDAYLNWSNITGSIPDPVVTVTLTGDVSGSASATLTDLGNGTATIATTIALNSVALGSDTTGNYVESITNGNYLTGGNGGSEGATLTLGVDATDANTGSKVVARDSSGNFSAGTITATLSGVATNATQTTIVSDSTNASRYLTFVDNTTGYNVQRVASSLTFNPSTGRLTATSFSGDGASLTGLNASNLSTGIVASGRMSGLYNISVTGVYAGTATSGMILQTDGVVSYWGWINGGSP